MKDPSPRIQNATILNTNGSVLSKLFILFTQLPKLITALPVGIRSIHHVKTSSKEVMTPEQFYINLLISMILVLLGGCFAGLTIGLMGQDEVYLKVMATSGDRSERAYARKVLNLIGRGKHWVLITLLLSNVITNETLPIVLDRCLGGGWPAVVASTASIVIFGEIIPQSICVRYGLEVGAYCAPFVLVLMYVMYPIAYPIALLLDHILGEDHGTVYKKSGLKTLVTLHQTMGVERLNDDEVTIISAVLDLKEKPVSAIMTPMDRVYTMSADAVLDEKTVEEIFNAGFSRIPIYLPGEPMNFIGMLLVRVLISYDPEDALPVGAFPLATLPETATDTSCLNILNYFQEGKSHMIVVSENPGEPYGALGVLTLEDVIEELIGEEIIDESDVYIDINKNIKRSQPGPLSKRHLTSYLHTLYQRSSNVSKRTSLDSNGGENGIMNKSQYQQQHKPENAAILNGVDGSKTWKPINPASNPLETSKSFVTIKRPDIESVKNSVLSPKRANQNKQSDIIYENDNIGKIHSSEQSAIDQSKAQFQDNGNDHEPKFLLPIDREADISDFKNKVSLPENGELNQQKYYRTGGIVESVVNVQGVHKTIIENVNDEEREFDLEEESASLLSKKSSRSSRKGSRTGSRSS